MPSAKEKEIEELIAKLVGKLKHREFVNSHQIAKATVILLRQVISKYKWNNARVLLDKVRSVGKRLVAANVNEVIVGNMVRRVMYIIRNEYIECEQDEDGDEDENENDENEDENDDESDDEIADDGASSAASKAPASNNNNNSSSNNSSNHGHTMLERTKSHSRLLNIEQKQDYQTYRGPNLKAEIQRQIRFLLSEIDESSQTIAQNALKYIHSDEIILTLGFSKTVDAFLKEAARKRNIQVIVAEAAPYLLGHKMAGSLAQAGIDTTLVTDSAAFAIMGRVNKVIIGTRAIMADGSLMAINGAHNIALAAKTASVPVIVLAGPYKISPEFKCTYNQDTFNNLVTPEEVMRYESETAVEASVANPLYDHVPSSLVTLFVIGDAAPAPSYLYHTLRELYYEEDLDI